MSVHRRLSAIMFADIEGYAAQQQQDEQKADRLREKMFRSLERNCSIYNGRIIRRNKEGALCIFNSSIEAVQAAISIQKEMRADPPVPLRIGIHSGDVLLEENAIYGKGVSIAAHIESFAMAGGVFVSGKIADDLKDQEDIQAMFLGAYELKNIKGQVDIYAITNDDLAVPVNKPMEGKKKKLYKERKKGTTVLWIIVASLLIIALNFLVVRQFWGQSSKKEKVIAVLPFVNLESSGGNEYYATGIYNELLTEISKIEGLNVLSRSTLLQYKGTNKSPRQIGSELGADVLLEGNVQKWNDKLRIHVQLTDTKTAKQLWAETYDRDIKDVFAIQTDIARQVADALNTTLSEKERSLFDSKPTANLQAYDFYLRGNKYAESYWEYNKLDEVPQAVRMYEQAIRIDTKFTASYNALIDLYLDIYWNKPFLNTDDYLKKAKEWLDKLQELNIDDVYSHKAMAAYKYKGQRDYEGALFELDVVDEKMGNGKSTYQLRAEILIRKGKIDEAIHYLSMQTELFPRVARYWAGMAETYKLKRNFDSAVACINRAIELSPDVPAYYTFKSMYYAELKGDIASATSVLKNAAYFVDTSGFRPDFIYFETLKGNYDYVIQLTLPNSGGIGLLWQYSVMPDDINLALMYQAKGKNQEAAHYFKKGYDLLLPLVNKYPDDFRLHASLGIALAGLGKKQEALKEGFRARDLMPPSKDVILAVSPLESLAQIYTLIGEDDEAIDILQQLLKMPFSWTMSNSIPLYRMYYSWKLLHSNARFRALLEDV